MSNETGISIFEELLQRLDCESAKFMLEDLRNPEKRNPQLYNSIIRLLDRHKMVLTKVEADEGVLGELASALPELTEDELAGFDYPMQ